MRLNRDISVLLLSVIADEFQICDPLAGSGIRSLRLLKELDSGCIKELYVNDYRSNFKQSFKDELKRNKLTGKKVSLTQEDATQCMAKLAGFDYVDIDPFGSPNPFLDMAVKRMSRRGILAVTATDTGPLCGSYPKACERKYWAKPLHNYLMHEAGLRILIRKVQLIGTQYDKALVPVLSYSKDHYMRIFFRVRKGLLRVRHLLGGLRDEFIHAAGDFFALVIL
jgi:tRNA (guanine26-N2/guanine27-N2)-dimethyltransferase